MIWQVKRMNNIGQKSDVIIIGAGPAGLFAAHRILEKSPKSKVLLIEKGNDINLRNCNENCEKCGNFSKCSLLCGVGGAGLFSDGKLVLDLHSGGLLDSITDITENEKQFLSQYIEKTLRNFDGVSKDGPIPSSEDKYMWSSLFNKNGLNIKHYDVLHMGSRNLKNIIRNFVDNLKKNPNFQLITNTEVINVVKNDDESLVWLSTGQRLMSKNIIFAVGKTGSEWIKNIFINNQIGFRKTKTYIGVRVETKHKNIAKLFDFSFDPKIWMIENDRKIKTHCFCRHGDVINTNYMGFAVVGGQTQITENNVDDMNTLSDKSNFNVLVSTEMEKEVILKLLNEFKAINFNGPVVQKVSSFLNNELDYNITDLPNNSKIGNIRKIFDEFDNIGSYISEFVSRLKNIVPDITDNSSLIYAPAIEWFMDTVNINPSMETECEGWFAVGDGAGLSQGIVHAAATGIIAAENICMRVEK